MLLLIFSFKGGEGKNFTGHFMLESMLPSKEFSLIELQYQL